VPLKGLFGIRSGCDDAVGAVGTGSAGAATGVVGVGEG